MPDHRHERLLYAHRGAAAEQPENTLRSFARALEVGAHALETDLHMTRDGHIVVSHDATGQRMAGVSARFRDVTLAQVKGWDAGYGFVEPDGHRPFVNKGYRVPTLEELLLELPGVPLNVDIKQPYPAMVVPLLSLLERTRSSDRVTVASFDTRTMLAVRRRAYAGATSMSMGEVISFLALPMSGWRALWRRFGGLAQAAQLPTHQGPVRLDTPERIRALREQGLRVDYWTIDEPAEAERLLRCGADGIMTNDPAAIRPVFDAFSP
jgi:glycerophosphoryl diester phosphodiesterase